MEVLASHGAPRGGRRRRRLGGAAQGAVRPGVPADTGQRHGGVGVGLDHGFAGSGRRFSGGRRGSGGRGAEGVGHDDSFRGVLEGVPEGGGLSTCSRLTLRRKGMTKRPSYRCWWREGKWCARALGQRHTVRHVTP
ncbi:unnamed protein product [Ectocarpus sp. 6 AP-2014]